jgi:hypothetical protein
MQWLGYIYSSCEKYGLKKKGQKPPVKFTSGISFQFSNTIIERHFKTTLWFLDFVCRRKRDEAYNHAPVVASSACKLKKTLFEQSSKIPR